MSPDRERSKNFVSTDRDLGGTKNGSNVLDRLEGGVGPLVREFEPGRSRTDGHEPIHPVYGYMPSLPVEGPNRFKTPPERATNRAILRQKIEVKVSGGGNRKKVHNPSCGRR